MAKLPVISGKEAIKRLQKFGFTVKRRKGSHVILHKGQYRVVVPDHKVLDRGTLRAILRHAKIDPDEFTKILEK